MYTTTQAYQPGPNLDATRSLLIGMKEKGTLQTYVASHKGKPEYPYLLALASSINQVSDATKAAQHQPAPQTVADQQLGSLAAAPAQTAQLPENIGIGQLAAPNMEPIGKAAGGIVAFGDGGEVPRFANDGLVYSPYSYGNTATQQQFTPAQLAEAKRLREMGMFDLLKEKFGPAWQTLTSGPAPVTKQETLQSGTDLGGPGSSPANTGVPVVGQTVGFQNQQGTQPPQNQQGTQGAQGAASTAGGIAGGFEKKFLDMLSKGEVSKEDRMKELTDINKPVLEKMTTLIEDNKNKLKSEGEQNFYMSLIQGGLAAAGASGPNALQNLAQGFEKGVGHYSEGLKDLRKAAQENSKMELSKAEYEASGKKDALKAYYDHQDKMQGYKAQGLASIMGHEISANAAIGAANVNRAAMGDYRNATLAESIRKNITDELLKIPEYKMDPMKLQAEVERQTTAQLKKYGNLAQFAGAPTGGGMVPSLKYNPQTGKIE